MTICIAAIAKEDDKEYIVFSTDHMVTTNMGQYEHSIVKYSKLNDNTIAMLAGQVLLFEDLIRLNDGNSDYVNIKLNIFDNFKKKRKEIIVNEIFDVFGINEEFFINSLQKEIPNPFIETILSKVADFKLNTAILLTGFLDSKAQITNIDETGVVDLRSMNFHAIGSGSIQAVNTLLFQKHSKTDSLLTTIYNVFKAKKNAEVSEGVGKETELLILKEDGMYQLTNEDLGILNKIYIEELQYGKSDERLNCINVEVK